MKIMDEKKSETSTFRSNKLLSKFILPSFIEGFLLIPKTKPARIRLPQGYELTLENESKAQQARKWLKENKWIYEPRTHAYYPPGTFDR